MENTKNEQQCAIHVVRHSCEQAKRRGRVKGQTFERPMITDSIIAPYKIKISEGSFDVFNGDSILAMGYYSTLPNALKAIALAKTNDSQTNFTLKEYIDKFNHTVEELKTLIVD
jgi:hypothetical protein